MKNTGFTLIENLVALLALVVVVTALLAVHLNILRAEQTARQLAESCRAAEAIIARQVFGLSSLAVESNTVSGLDVSSEPVLGVGVETQGEVWERWTIAPSNRPGLGVQFELTGGGSSTSAPAAATSGKK